VLWRIHQLRKDKIQLEIIVRERTAEVVKQKNEIEEKSKSLETALSELGEAQHELVRQEKMATVGKLTQGLIDRILNPLNYINNFSKLSQGLVNDVTANIEDEKEHMDPEIYDDTIDVLGMLKGNLEKVSEHGANTTRTLKAMEEMLKDRTGGISQVDIIALIRQNEDMLGKYFEKEISGHHIKIAFNYPNSAVKVNGNPEQLSKTFMSLLSNAIYAVVKKAQRKEYAPEVDLTITPNEQEVEILIRDNGIGIEDTIIHKIFDPFFTTKTTGEASGVGLYLSREIIQNYGGDITVKSQKDEYTEFSIILPTLK
jgi:signal transduction histidine kinase